MATRIRLRRVGRKKVPLYRIVVADQESARDGRFIAVVGSYDPRAAAAKQVTLNTEQARHWLDPGANPHDTAKGPVGQAGARPAQACPAPATPPRARDAR